MIRGDLITWAIPTFLFTKPLMVEYIFNIFQLLITIVFFCVFMCVKNSGLDTYEMKSQLFGISSQLASEKERLAVYFIEACWCVCWLIVHANA